MCIYIDRWMIDRWTFWEPPIPPSVPPLKHHLPSLLLIPNQVLHIHLSSSILCGGCVSHPGTLKHNWFPWCSRSWSDLWPGKNWLFTRPVGLLTLDLRRSLRQSQPITLAFDSLAAPPLRGREIGLTGVGVADHKNIPSCCDGAYVEASAYWGRSVGFLSRSLWLTSLGLCVYVCYCTYYIIPKYSYTG